MKKPFYVRVVKCSAEGLWYKEFIESIFLVKPISSMNGWYELVDGCAWIKKADCRIFRFKNT